MKDPLTFFQSLNFDLPAKFAGDASFIFVFAGVSLGLGLFMGRYKLVNLLISVYAALALAKVIPDVWLDPLGPYGELGVFVVALLVLTIFDERMFDLHMSSRSTDFFWRLFVMSFVETGLILSILLSLAPRELALSYVSPTIFAYFASPVAVAVWALLPLAILLFINKRLR